MQEVETDMKAENEWVANGAKDIYDQDFRQLSLC